MSAAVVEGSTEVEVVKESALGAVSVRFRAGRELWN